MNDPAQARGLPPWIQPDMQRRIAWRDGDIVIAVPPKSGTTWTMNIVHQLLSGGDPDFADIYGEVPWIEFVTRPGMPVEELLERLESMPADRRRAFKTHSQPSLFDTARELGQHTKMLARPWKIELRNRSLLSIDTEVAVEGTRMRRRDELGSSGRHRLPALP